MTGHPDPGTPARFTRDQAAQIADTVAFGADGLVTAVAQQYDTGRVLMVAWMTRAALIQTLTTGRVTYWSRSRGELWRKGDTSGHTQQLVELRVDCDGDSLLLLIEQTGPACHTGAETCFYRRATDAGLREV
jgi:phosphoribosyl-AMP cyclohydrolase